MNSEKMQEMKTMESRQRFVEDPLFQGAQLLDQLRRNVVVELGVEEPLQLLGLEKPEVPVHVQQPGEVSQVGIS